MMELTYYPHSTIKNHDSFGRNTPDILYSFGTHNCQDSD
ncbi:uncharacterized protein METZ01_LOCUS163322 [marine metagenome]|uniref:Uncharacterized protein n=1 Tax=marine metagenome TaxID=408172 RepID=A0A382B9M6_9ZZZZ